MNRSYIPLLFKQGDTFHRQLKLIDDEDQPFNLIAADLVFSLKSGGQEVLQVPLTIPEPTLGLASLVVSGVDTEALSDTTRYTYEVILSRDGELSTVVVGGLMVLRNDS